MLRKLLIAILLTVLTLSSVTNFTPIDKGGFICFPPDQAFEILTRLENESNYLYKIDLLELEVQRADAKLATEKKKKVKIFFQGVAVGGGVASLGIAILAFKIVLM